MATYKFSQFNVEITNPTVYVIGVVDSINEKTCSVNVVLTTDSATFGVNFSGFNYTETWTDEEIILWVNNVELPKYEVNG
jgi:hypothetical protein